MAFIGEERLKQSGYTEEQVRTFETRSRAADLEPRVSGSPSSPEIRFYRKSPSGSIFHASVPQHQGIASAASIKGTWRQGTGGYLELRSPTHVKTRLTERERDIGPLPAEAIRHDVRAKRILVRDPVRQQTRWIPVKEVGKFKAEVVALRQREQQQQQIRQETQPTAQQKTQVFVPETTQTKTVTTKIPQVVFSGLDKRGETGSVFYETVSKQPEITAARGLPPRKKTVSVKGEPLYFQIPEADMDVKKMVGVGVVAKQEVQAQVEAEKKWRRETGWQRLPVSVATGAAAGAGLGGLTGGWIGAGVGVTGGAAAGFFGQVWEDVAFEFMPEATTRDALALRRTGAGLVGLGAGLGGGYGTSWVTAKGLVSLAKNVTVMQQPRVDIKPVGDIDELALKSTGVVRVETQRRLLGRPLVSRQFGISTKATGVVTELDDIAIANLDDLALYYPKGGKYISMVGKTKVIPTRGRVSKSFFQTKTALFPEKPIELSTKQVSRTGFQSIFAERAGYGTVTKTAGSLDDLLAGVAKTKTVRFGDVKSLVRQTTVTSPFKTKVSMKGISRSTGFAPQADDITTYGLVQAKKIIVSEPFKGTFFKPITVVGKRSTTLQQFFVQQQTKQLMKDTAEAVFSSELVSNVSAGAVGGAVSTAIPKTVQISRPRLQEEEEILYFAGTPSPKELAGVGLEGVSGVASLVVPGVSEQAIVSQRAMMRPSIGAVERTLQVYVPKTKPLIIPKQADVVKSLAKQAEAMITLPATIPRAVQMPKQSQRIVPRQIPRQLTRAIVVPKMVTPTKVTEIIKPPVSFFPPLLLPATGKRPPSQKVLSFAQGFLPQVRRRGEWISVGKPMTEKMAKQWGAFYAIQGPARSYRALRAGRPATKVKGPRLPAFWRMQFRQPKSRELRQAGAMVERSKYALSQRGEFLGITMKGLEAMAQGFYGKRRKRKKGKKKRRRSNGLYNMW